MKVLPRSRLLICRLRSPIFCTSTRTFSLSAPLGLMMVVVWTRLSATIYMSFKFREITRLLTYMINNWTLHKSILILVSRLGLELIQGLSDQCKSQVTRFHVNYELRYRVDKCDGRSGDGGGEVAAQSGCSHHFVCFLVIRVLVGRQTVSWLYSSTSDSPLQF